MSNNYVKVPNSDLKLVDGSVVMLARFPGTKWVVHEGWYTYNSSQYSGWYFCSIPAKTVIPVNEQDMVGIVLVSGKYEETEPEIPGCPPVICPPIAPDLPGIPGCKPPLPPCPGTFPPGPGPHPPVPGPMPFWPPGPWPPKPPGPEPELPAFFSVKKEALLNAAFVSLPTLKHRDDLNTDDIPDGKIVRVNSVNGKPAYYIWSKFDVEWKQVSVESIVEDMLTNYYTKDDVNQLIRSVDKTADVALLLQAVEDLRQADETNMAAVNESITAIDERLADVEDAVFDVKKLAELSGSNTVLVANKGSISDSGVAIGDGEIGEPAEYADVKTLATEKAVAKKVEDSMLKWTSF